MTLEEALEINGDVCRFIINSHIDEPTGPIPTYSLREMLDARDIVNAENARQHEEMREGGGGTHAIRTVSADRIIAALIVLRDFQPQRPGEDLEPILQDGKSALVNVVMHAAEA